MTPEVNRNKDVIGNLTQNRTSINNTEIKIYKNEQNKELILKN
jgi:hypothetical protein